MESLGEPLTQPVFPDNLRGLNTRQPLVEPALVSHNADDKNLVGKGSIWHADLYSVVVGPHIESVFVGQGNV